MGLLQSLGLTGASKAVRRLLHRPSRSSPAAPANSGSRSPSQQDVSSYPPGASPSSHQSAADLHRQAEIAPTISNNHDLPHNQEASTMLKTSSSAIATPSQRAVTLSNASREEPRQDAGNKEHYRPAVDTLADGLAGVYLDPIEAEDPASHVKASQSIYDSDDPSVQAEKARHQRFTEEALDMARLALRTNETPVGCVLVHKDTVIAKGMNATNVTRNGTRHAEFMALTALLSYPPKDGPRTLRLLSAAQNLQATPSETGSISSLESDKTEGNEDGSKGHLYPYGQKLYPEAIVDQAILKECVLYVTVEPCVMCASLLRQFGIKKVYFGAVNDKFGGTGGVFSIHANADPNAASIGPRTTSRQPPSLVGAAGTLGESFPVGGGDGGNVERGYEIEGGWGRDEAVGLLRRFYVQENGRAPVPRKKEGRAARLAALMDKDGPDAVGATLSCVDGVSSVDQAPSPVSVHASTPIADCGGMNNTRMEAGLIRPNIRDEDAGSDKENASRLT